MLSDLLKLVMRGERGEGKSHDLQVGGGGGGGGGGGQQLQRIHLPHAKLQSQQHPPKNRSKKFYKSSQGVINSSTPNPASSTSTSSSSYLSLNRRRGDSSKSYSKNSKKKEYRGKGKKGSHKNEDIYEEYDFKDSLGIGSHHSSKVSLLEGRNQVVDNEPVAGAAPLSHQAALHKISIRPRRTHGAPRSRRATQIGGQMSLPATPEVNEESNNKNATTPKPTTATVPPQETPVMQFDSDDQNRQDSQMSVETRESEKKDKEEKRDEPLLQRLIGSVRSGRRRSRGNGDDSRENSASPMRRGSEQRNSREKRRDSSGSRFPVLGKTNTRTRQDPHPLPPSGRAREPSRERSNKEVSPSSPQTPRSASVEGRLESTTPGPQSVFRMSSYEERTARPLEGVRKVKSFREVHGHNINQEVHSKIITPEVSAEENIDILSRKTASMESLDGDTKTSSSRTISSSGATETSVSPHRSSVDSLTNTSLPGVFIRQQSHNQYKVFKHKHQEQQLLTRQQVHSGQDVNSGPLSLDSSITLQSREPEDLLRKASSVSHMGYSVDSPRSSFVKEMDTTESVSKRGIEIKSGAKAIVIEEKSDSGSVDTKKSGHSVVAETEGLKYGSSDDGDTENESLRRRSLKKEPSMKRLLSREIEPSPVPEFMRIQLNRVESKGHSVIYDTDQDKHIKVDAKGADILNMQVDNDSTPAIVIFEKPCEGSHSMKVEPSHIISESKTDKSLNKKSNNKAAKGLSRDVSPSAISLDKKDHDSGVEGSSPEPTIDRVVLRKPLVSERVPVMERASSVTSQTTPSPPKGDQPELFKVFARRSFKVKDADKEKFQSIDSDDGENIEASSEISEVTVVSTRAADNVTALSGSTEIHSSIISMSQAAVPGLQKSSINAISFNRKSVGNPTLSFCPPPVTNMSTPPTNSPLSAKPNVLIISSSSSVTSTSTVTGSSNSSCITTSSSTSSCITTTSTAGSLTSNQYSKVSTAASVQVSVIRPSSTTPEAIATSEMSTPTASPQQSGISSRIISSRLASLNITTSNESISVDESESNHASPTVSSTPSKPPRSGSGIVWPPRPYQEEDNQPSQLATQSNVSSQLRRLSSSPSNSVDLEVSRTPTKMEENQDPVEISPLNISAARRRFMSGGKDCHSVITHSAQTLPAVSTVSSSGPSLQSSSSPALGSPASAAQKSGSAVTEARNSAPSFTITVRTQSTTEPSDNSGTTSSVTNTSLDLNSSTTSNSSVGKSEQGTPAQAAEDWRMLVRQRREGRLKQTKTPDSEEILIETRPPVSRNSKVLEMANNFQKLQVA